MVCAFWYSALAVVVAVTAGVDIVSSRSKDVGVGASQGLANNAQF